MIPEDLQYGNLTILLSSYSDKGRGESVSFLNWFLENIFRLDSISADDSICDRPNDRGIDGVYVDHDQEKIVILQGKIRQKEATVGDAPLRDLAGTLTQFKDRASVEALQLGGGNEELKKLLLREHVADLVEKGYGVIGSFVTNLPLDANGREFLDQAGNIRAYDRNRICSEFIDIEAKGGVEGEFSLDASYVDPMKIQTGDEATSYIFPAKASELVGMSGIDDGTLFSQNVRLSLGNTKVNKSLEESIKDKREHKNFPLYHNGVTILCSSARYINETVVINNYMVVNGAQSISTFKKSSSHLTDDLRVLVKIVELNNTGLARKITVNSNNQNAIKARDLKSNNEVQIRLKEEMKEVSGGEFDLEIKRGEKAREGAKVITNEEAGRLLLASDLGEPYSCHQIYKLFDEKYAEIFARPAVSAWRIILLHKVMERVEASLERIDYKPLARYGLTRFFILSCVFSLIQEDEASRDLMRSPRKVFEDGLDEKFCDAVTEVLKTLIVDLNYEVKSLGEGFDYKGDLKSPSKVAELRGELMRSHKKDVEREKAAAFGLLLV
ncbi:AIPR family protein [Amorphus coralli]|uniref:AIPR family protein n=1 Tax=Amorphus coralli TaxID=340680 RepID=UPI00041FD2CF|nr:AIPR family protein [Amorphus coralli]